jgi:hypothetical protein
MDNRVVGAPDVITTDLVGASPMNVALGCVLRKPCGSPVIWVAIVAIEVRFALLEEGRLSLAALLMLTRDRLICIAETCLRD